MIFDDTDWTSISKDDLKKVSELFRFGSSHHNISIILLHQIFSRVPKVCRDCSNVLIIYRPVDLDSLDTVGRRCGLKKEEIRFIFDKYMSHYRNSLTVNLIPNAPYKFLKDVFEPLSLPFWGGN